MPTIRLTKTFAKRYRGKPEALKKKIKKCLRLLGTDPFYPGLESHKIHGSEGVFESYIDGSNRVTWEYGDNCIVMRNNCNHDVIERSP